MALPSENCCESKAELLNSPNSPMNSVGFAASTPPPFAEVRPFSWGPLTLRMGEKLPVSRGIKSLLERGSFTYLRKILRL